MASKLSFLAAVAPAALLDMGVRSWLGRKGDAKSCGGRVLKQEEEEKRINSNSNGVLVGGDVETKAQQFQGLRGLQSVLVGVEGVESVKVQLQDEHQEQDQPESKDVSDSKEMEQQGPRLQRHGDVKLELAEQDKGVAAADAADLRSFQVKWMALEREIHDTYQQHKEFVSEFLEMSHVQKRKLRPLLLGCAKDGLVSRFLALRRDVMAFCTNYAKTMNAAEAYLNHFLVSVLERVGTYVNDEDPRLLEQLAATLKATKIKLGNRRGDEIREKKKSARSRVWRLLYWKRAAIGSKMDSFVSGEQRTMRMHESCVAKRREEIAEFRQQLKRIDEMLNSGARVLVNSQAVDETRCIVKLGKEKAQEEEIVRSRSRSKSKVVPEETGKTDRLLERSNPVPRKFKTLEERIEREAQLRQQQDRFMQASREFKRFCETVNKPEPKTTKSLDLLPPIEEDIVTPTIEEKEAKKNRFHAKFKFSCFSSGG